MSPDQRPSKAIPAAADHAASGAAYRAAPGTAWPQADLVRRVCLALRIAERTITTLGATGYVDDDAVDSSSFGPDKPLAETAMLLHVAAGITNAVAAGITNAAAAGTKQAVDAGVTGYAEITALIDRVTALLLPLVRSPRTACALALHPSIGLQLAMPHILLKRRGHADPHFDQLLTRSLESRAAHGREVVPHRALEAMWLQSLWTDTAPDAAFDAVAAVSVLNHPLDLIWGTREDAYAFTHTFMYFTDFGHAARPLPRDLTAILAEAEAVLARALLLEDFDLAAETLMAWPQVAAPWSAAAIFGMRVLATLEDRVGFLPARNGIPEKFDRLAGDERTRYALAAAYHTAYVMGMVCALALRSEHGLPHAVTGPQFPAAVVAELLAMIPDAETPWRTTFAALGPVERLALAPMLLDLALVANARAHDFAAAGRLLNLAVHHGLADRQLCAQVTELLQRIDASIDRSAD